MIFKTVTINAKPPSPHASSQTFRFLWQDDNESVILTIVGCVVEHYKRVDAQKLYRELMGNGATIQPQGVETHDSDKQSYGSTICRSLEMLRLHG